MSFTKRHFFVFDSCASLELSFDKRQKQIACSHYFIINRINSMHITYKLLEERVCTITKA